MAPGWHAFATMPKHLGQLLRAGANTEYFVHIGLVFTFVCENISYIKHGRASHGRSRFLPYKIYCMT